MLWRTSYEPVVIREPSFEVGSDQSSAIIGLFSVLAHREAEVWWRLFEADFPGDVIELAVGGIALRNELVSIRPPSRHERVLQDPDAGKWRTQLESVVDERAFCAIVRKGVVELIVIGPATEEVWEEVSSLWRSIRT